MTYFGFLLRFIVIPILLLGVVNFIDTRRKREMPASLQSLSPWLMSAMLIMVAVVYTTPWDNYLVATGVWGYDPALVTGITLGWVPIEEYTFFILQPIMSTLWLVFLARRIHVDAPFTPHKRIRIIATTVVSVCWLIALAILLSGSKHGNYLALELVWALPPIALQVFFGADILWHYRRLVFLAIASITLYLGVTDALAINSGTWIINPELTTGILLGGILPIEEAIFFLLTSILLVFGMVLGMAKESLSRLPTQIMRRDTRKTLWVNE